jgi:hypothetical protein
MEKAETLTMKATYVSTPGRTREQAAAHVWIRLSQAGNRFRVPTFEKKNGLMHRLGERAAQQKFAALARLSSQGEVFRAVLGSVFQIVF